MSTEPRAISIRTADAGEVALVCPAWCTTEHEQDGYRADILHSGPDVALVFQGRTISDASLVESPFAEVLPRTTGVSVSLLSQTLDPVQLYDLAATLDRHADQLRDLADQLHALLTGEGQ